VHCPDRSTYAAKPSFAPPGFSYPDRARDGRTPGRAPTPGTPPPGSPFQLLLWATPHAVPPAELRHETIFLNHDRLDCRRENLKVVTKEEARRHHRVRSDSRSGVKGVRFNPDGGTWTAITYRHGQCYHVGTYYTREQAEAAYERDLRRENPDLHTAPARVERPSNPVPVQPGDPEAPRLIEAR
jgi:hypothetical protein